VREMVQNNTAVLQFGALIADVVDVAISPFARSKQAYAKREYPLKPQAEHQVVRPNLE
jgi:hypothetical protein